MWEFLLRGPADQVHGCGRVTDQPVGDQVAARFEEDVQWTSTSPPTWRRTSSSSTSSSSARSSRSSRRTTTSASSTTAARTPAPTGTAAACRTRSGRRCSREARRRADAAGHYRYPFPKEYGGQDGTNLGMAVIREHLAAQGPRAAQRPAERALDRRQQRRPAADDRVRHRRAEGGVDRRPRRGAPRASRSASPSRSTAPTPRTWRPPPSATATSGSSTARRRGTPASTRPSTT